ncbi:MAG: efflux RND transporter periplasmic adaptor subunit [Deltaproteobacteria bacterium]|nr:efflux RND transporter periplasmic adaptor subunit [Deltaproteobacteria bacterium]
MKKNLFILLLLSCLAFSACHSPQEDALFQFSGTLEMTEHGVGFPMQGRLAALYVEEGDNVQQGQLLGYLDHYELAKKEYQRLDQLFKEGGTHQQAVEKAQQAMLDQQAISPVDGVVLTKVHETGEVLSSNNILVIIGDRQSLWVRIFVPEGLINRVKLGQSAQLRFDGLKESFSGKVEFIAPQAEFTPRNVQTPEERVTQTFAVKVYLEHPPQQLRPGVPADVFLELPQTLSQ